MPWCICGGSEARDRESILSFYPVHLGIEFRFAGSVANAFTHQAILLALIITIVNNNNKIFIFKEF